MMNPKLTLGIAVTALITAILLGGQINPSNETPPTSSTARTPAQPTAPEPTTRPQPKLAEPNGTSQRPREGRAGEEEPVATPNYEGAEDPQWEMPAELKDAAISATKQFIGGWLEPHHDSRGHLLEPVTAPALADELSIPELRVWNTTPAGAPSVVEQAATAVITHQAFTDGRAVDVLLTLDPGTQHGWIVTDIHPSKD